MRAGPLVVACAGQDAGDAFRAVDGARAAHSGELLLVEAYAAIWLVAFVLLLLSLRRQRRMEARIARLEADLARARGESEERG